ncbi:hypothetical protein TNCV_1866771 [Trichonephila clavipes]|nr:hypothetical protein TNCV_1866771 [Trichonephila clavipes]
MVKCRGRHLSWHPPLVMTTPQQWEDASALDRFNAHRCPTRRVFSGTGLELELVPEPDEIVNLIEEVVDLTRQMN